MQNALLVISNLTWLDDVSMARNAPAFTKLENSPWCDLRRASSGPWNMTASVFILILIPLLFNCICNYGRFWPSVKSHAPVLVLIFYFSDAAILHKNSFLAHLIPLSGLYREVRHGSSGVHQNLWRN
jgi:hypothetical protein